MRVAIINQYSSAGGGARFTRALVAAILEADSQVQVGLFADADNVERDDLVGLFGNVDRIQVVPMRNGLAVQRGASEELRNQAGRLYWAIRRRLKKVTAFSKLYYWVRERTVEETPSWADFALDDKTIGLLNTYDLVYLAWPYFIEPAQLQAPVIITTHDFNYKYPFGNFPPKMLEVVERQVPAWIRLSSCVVVSSKFIEDELKTFYPEELKCSHVVRLTHFSITAPDAEERQVVKARLGLPEEYMLCASNTARHKNLPKLLEAVGIMKSRGELSVPLVLSGHGTESIGCFESGNFAEGHPLYAYQVMAQTLTKYDLELGRDVIALGYVSDEEIDALVAGARLMVSPSLYEAGSGPAVDAWSSETPVAFSCIPPFTEQIDFLGTEAWVFDPNDARDMATVLARALSDPGACMEMARRSADAISHRTWNDIGSEYLAIMRQTIAETPASKN